MTKTPQFELVSFTLCPYVQRSVITALHKKVPFKLTHIDLFNPPAWFEKISPLGKVPLLLVREKEGADPTVLFESAVINEYLDEVTPPLLMPKDPLVKARERAWIEVASEILSTMYPMMTSSDVGDLSEAQNEVFEILKRVEEALPGGSTFRGSQFSLVDSSFAPAFVRLFLYKPVREDARWKELPKVYQWAQALLNLPEVRESMIPDFKKEYAAAIRKYGSAWADQVD